MRTGAVSALLFLQLLLLLLVTTQGIRLPRESAASSSSSSSSSSHGKDLQAEEANWVGASSVNIIGEVVLCRDGHCSGAGGSTTTRKLQITTNTMPSTATSESGRGERVLLAEEKPTESHNKFDKKREDLSVKPTHPAHETTTKYPDVFDLAGMDYSPAKRKPPIHN